MTHEELPDLLPGLPTGGGNRSHSCRFTAFPNSVLWKFIGNTSLAVSLSSLPHRNLLTREKHVRIQPVVVG